MALLRRPHPSMGEIADTEVSRECEAFLAGTLAETVLYRGEPPVWTWLNALAHGDAATLHALATSDAPGVRSVTTRTIASAVLADGADLATLQRNVLVPLELAHVGEIMTPRRLVELVGRALYGS